MLKKRIHTNRELLNMFNNNVQNGTLTLTFSRRDIIEGHMLGMLPFDNIVSKLDLHSGYTGLQIQISKKDGMYTVPQKARITYLRGQCKR